MKPSWRWASRRGSTTNPGRPRWNGWQHSRQSTSRVWWRAIPARAARPCCRAGRRPSWNVGWCPTRPPRKQKPSCAPICRKRGFGDIEVNGLGRLRPHRNRRNSRVIRAQQAVYARAGVQQTLYPRNAGSWPGSVFTQPPVSLPAGQFGLGHGSGAHAPNEYFVIELSNPKVQGLAGCTMGFVDFLYEMAIVR